MTVFLITFVFFALIITLMAVGVIVKNKPIKGSCGGLNDVGIDGACVICGKDGKPKGIEQSDLFYDAATSKGNQ